MSRSGYPSVMFLEFRDGKDRPRLVGSDAIFYVDGRYGRGRISDMIWEKEKSFRKYYNDPKFRCVGYTQRGSSTIYPL